MNRHAPGCRAGWRKRLRFTDRFASQSIIFGWDELGQLSEVLTGLSSERALLLTSGSYRRNGTVERVQALLGGNLAAVFNDVQQHVPAATVEVARLMARETAADALVSLGGGSAIGLGKALAVALAEDLGEIVPLVAVPTTYAGSEMTPVYGITQEQRKVTRSDPRALPSTVIYDPSLTLDLPVSVAAGTGANALAHCVEGAYSRRRTPIAITVATASLSRIMRFLPEVIIDGDRTTREEMMLGAHLAGVALAHAGMALHHAICHGLGAHGVPHGTANTIMLPHVMRFNLEPAAAELADSGRGLRGDDPAGADQDLAERLLSQVETLMDSLPLPHRLSETSVTRQAFADIAEQALNNSSTRNNPRPVRDTAEIVAILEEAW